MTDKDQEDITTAFRIGARLGFKFLIFEPMCIPREMACTIDSTKELLERLNEDGLPIPTPWNLSGHNVRAEAAEVRENTKEGRHLLKAVKIIQKTVQEGRRNV